MTSLPVRAASGARQRGSTSFEAVYDGTEEYAWDGGVRYGVPSLQVRFADGTRGLELDHAGHEITGDALTISSATGTTRWRWACATGRAGTSSSGTPR